MMGYNILLLIIKEGKDDTHFIVNGTHKIRQMHEKARRMLLSRGIVIDRARNVSESNKGRVLILLTNHGDHVHKEIPWTPKSALPKRLDRLVGPVYL